MNETWQYGQSFECIFRLIRLFSDQNPLYKHSKYRLRNVYKISYSYQFEQSKRKFSKKIAFLMSGIVFHNISQAAISLEFHCHFLNEGHIFAWYKSKLIISLTIRRPTILKGSSSSVHFLKCFFFHNAFSFHVNVRGRNSVYNNDSVSAERFGIPILFAHECVRKNDIAAE